MGKKIIMGGSITLMTHAVAKYIPSTRRPRNHTGRPTAAQASLSQGWTSSSRSEARSCEGTLAPLMVSHSMPAKRSNMTGNPQVRLVTMRSIQRSTVMSARRSGRETQRFVSRAAWE